MEQVRFPRAALLVLLAAAALTAGCGTTSGSVPVPIAHAPSSSTPTALAQTTSRPTPPRLAISTPAPAAAARGGHGGRGSPGTVSQGVAGSLPADWPPDLPVPQGDIRGFTGSAGRWTVLILAAGSAAHVRQTTVALYTAAGFTAVTDSVLNKGQRQITLVVENRDHSATQTNLVIGVTTR
jgi:hypothetical protein